MPQNIHVAYLGPSPLEGEVPRRGGEGGRPIISAAVVRRTAAAGNSGSWYGGRDRCRKEELDVGCDVAWFTTIPHLSPRFATQPTRGTTMCQPRNTICGVCPSNNFA